MTVVLKTVRGVTEIFDTQSYMVAKKKDMHPDILDVKVYAGGKCVKRVKRRFQAFYKKFLYKPLPPEAKKEAEPAPNVDK